MFTFLTGVHIITCLFLILVVLVQQGKGADMGATFGGGSGTLFGASGADNLLTRATTLAAAIFMSTSVYLAVALKPGGSFESSMFKEDPNSTVDLIPMPEGAATGQPAPAADGAANPADGSAPAAPGSSPKVESSAPAGAPVVATDGAPAAGGAPAVTVEPSAATPGSAAPVTGAPAAGAAVKEAPVKEAPVKEESSAAPTNNAAPAAQPAPTATK